MTYLGTVVSEDGHVCNELARRIGCARADFKSLCKIWNHSTLPWRKKLAIFASLIESKLLYGLACCCFTVAEERQLNGFQARCIRQILRIKPSFYSRVSNKSVLLKAEHLPATELLRQQQLKLLGKVLRAPLLSPLHKAAMIPGTDQPITSFYVRRRGRPRKEWVSTVMKTAHQRNPDCHDMFALAQDEKLWQQCVQKPAL